MSNNTNKTMIGDEPITIPAAQFARILAAAVYSDFLRENRAKCEARIVALKAELTRYQRHCEKCKIASDAGASKEPQIQSTSADETKTDARRLAIGAEGRVSGGERAGFTLTAPSGGAPESAEIPKPTADSSSAQGVSR